MNDNDEEGDDDEEEEEGDADPMYERDKVNLAGFHFRLNFDDIEDASHHYCIVRMVMKMLKRMMRMMMMILCRSETRLIWRAFTLTLQQQQQQHQNSRNGLCNV